MAGGETRPGRPEQMGDGGNLPPTTPGDVETLRERSVLKDLCSKVEHRKSGIVAITDRT